MQSFLQDRIRLVRDLLTSGPEVAYGDLVLILCAVMSACAAARWPGEGIDRKRFLELLVRHSKPDHRTVWVSVPALISSGVLCESRTPYGDVGNADRIYRDHEIDLPLGDAMLRYSDIDERKLRKHTYAGLIYEWLRCGYAHEYCPHGSISTMPASRFPARVSYIGRYDGGTLTRMVTFHLDYLIELTEHHVANLAISPMTRPTQWWSDGA